VEYILVLVLMGILAIGVVKALGQKTQKGFIKASAALEKEFGD
jgi:Flp pilus assembly pilin Flp